MLAPTVVVLACAALLLVLAIAAVWIGRTRAGTTIIYGTSLVIALTAFLAGMAQLLRGGVPADDIMLPLGLPWIGVRFRMDALSAFFVVVVDLGAATASLFAIGYGSHERARLRVLRSIRRSLPA